MGFIKDRNSSNNVRRLLNVIQYFSTRPVDDLVVSLDEEKAFDHIKWPFLSYTMQKFGLGETFICWVKSLYKQPLATVLTNGLHSDYFHTQRRVKQGCLLSPLLFSLAVEALAEAIRSNTTIHGLTIGEKQHKITIYADYVSFFLLKPEISTPNLITVIRELSGFSGYCINFSKSDNMPVGALTQIPTVLPPFPFRWSPSRIIYLGIFKTPTFGQLFKANFTPLFDQVRTDLKKWNTLPISWLGCVRLLKN